MEMGGGHGGIGRGACVEEKDATGEAQSHWMPKYWILRMTTRLARTVTDERCMRRPVCRRQPSPGFSRNSNAYLHSDHIGRRPTRTSIQSRNPNRAFNSLSVCCPLHTISIVLNGAANVSSSLLPKVETAGAFSLRMARDIKGIVTMYSLPVHSASTAYAHCAK